MVKTIVIDTSVIISALIGKKGPSREILRRSLLGEYKLLISNEIKLLLTLAAFFLFNPLFSEASFTPFNIVQFQPSERWYLRSFNRYPPFRGILNDPHTVHGAKRTAFFDKKIPRIERFRVYFSFLGYHFATRPLEQWTVSAIFA